EAVAGFFFLVVALAMVGPGQELGRALARVPDRVQAYTVNILGSLVGIVVFAGFSWLQLSPLWWFLPVVAGVAYLLVPARLRGTAWWGRALHLVPLLLLLQVAGFHAGVWTVRAGGQERTWEFLWSPYYRIDYERPPVRLIAVNLIGHQQMRA